VTAAGYDSLTRFLLAVVAPGTSWMPIRELSRRLGVSPDLLRKWERRYGVLNPSRTRGNQRLYSPVDEARARVMLRQVRDGMSAAQAAELAIATRFRMTPKVGAPSGDARQAAKAGMAAALERFDETGAEWALEKLLATSAAPTVITEVFLPYLREVGERWSERRLSVAQEHFGTGFILSRLLALARGWDRGLGPRALLACPAGEQHTCGLIAYGIALHEVGWRITYLGADTPARMVAEAAAVVSPRRIVMSAAMPERFHAEVRELSALGSRWPLALGGAGASRALARRCGATYLDGDPVTAAYAVFA
jgi:MerR family transcriptional regulator, light-induced transcriptional regulator